MAPIHWRRLGADFWGNGNFRMTILGKKCPFYHPKFLTTFLDSILFEIRYITYIYDPSFLDQNRQFQTKIFLLDTFS